MMKAWISEYNIQSGNKEVATLASVEVYISRDYTPTTNMKKFKSHCRDWRNRLPVSINGEREGPWKIIEESDEYIISLLYENPTVKLSSSFPHPHTPHTPDTYVGRLTSTPYHYSQERVGGDNSCQ